MGFRRCLRPFKYNLRALCYRTLWIKCRSFSNKMAFHRTVGKCVGVLNSKQAFKWALGVFKVLASCSAHISPVLETPHGQLASSLYLSIYWLGICIVGVVKDRPTHVSLQKVNRDPPCLFHSLFTKWETGSGHGKSHCERRTLSGSLRISQWVLHQKPSSFTISEISDRCHDWNLGFQILPLAQKHQINDFQQKHS